MPARDEDLRRRIVNACTTMPRTCREIATLLQATVGQVEWYLKQMCNRSAMHKVGSKLTTTGNSATLYSVHPKPVTLPHLTVWRGPLPPEWRM